MPDPGVPLVALREMLLHRGGRRVLGPLTWDLRTGESWFIVGSNGSGKSTLLRILRGELWPDPPTSSRLYFETDGSPTESPIGFREHTSLVSAEQQDAYRRRENDITLRDVVRSGVGDRIYPHPQLDPPHEEMASQLIHWLGLADLETRPFNSLSTGEARRTLVARALISQPRLLLLDEVFNGMDRRSREILRARLGALTRSGIQIILTTHRPTEVLPEIRNRLLLQEGRVVANHASPDRPPLQGVLPAPPSGELLVDIRQTDVAMDGVRILHGLNWQWRRGEHWMITGENGSGKSTFLKLLVGDAVPELGGDVQRRGLANHASIWEIRELVGIVSPEWQARLDPHAPAEIIVASGFTGALAHFTDTAASHLVSARALLAEWGARQLATRPFGELSYGQSRFVTLLRAVVAAPRLLLLDEVFDGLDREWHERARALVLREAGRGAHLLIVSHHPEEIAGLHNRQATFHAGRMMLTDGASRSPLPFVE